MAEPYKPRRDGRFENVRDLVRHIEESSCRHGCTVPEPHEVAEFGPGGCCPVLASTILEEPMDELSDDGTTVTCLVRQAAGPDV